MKRKPLYLSQQTTKQKFTTMKTTIFSKTKANGLGIENGKAITVELNRYAEGYWPLGLSGITHEYELLTNG